MTNPPSQIVIKNPTWWRRRTQMERGLIFMTISTALLCVVLIAALAVTSYKEMEVWSLPLGSFLNIEMDPLDVLHREEVECVWTRLGAEDLLSCRIVSKRWRDSVQSCRRAWGTRGFDDFLERRRILRMWGEGRYTIRRCDIPADSILLVGEDSFFASSEKTNLLEKYDSRGKKVKSVTCSVEKMSFHRSGLTVYCGRMVRTFDFDLNPLENFVSCGFNCYADTLVLNGTVRYVPGGEFHPVPDGFDTCDVLDGFLLLGKNSLSDVDFYHFVTEPRHVLNLKSSPLYIAAVKVYKGGKMYCIKDSMRLGKDRVDYTTLRIFESDRLVTRFDMAQEILDCLFTGGRFIVAASDAVYAYTTDFKGPPLKYDFKAFSLERCDTVWGWFYALGTHLVLIDPEGRTAVIPHSGILQPLPTMSALNSTETTQQAPRRELDICLEPGCIHAASMVLNNMDMSVEPCDDFYQFVCGEFRKKFIPDHKSALNYFSLISDKLEGQLRDILSEPSTEDEIQPIRDAKSLYSLCMNETKIETKGVEPVLKVFDSLGGWPVLDENWDRDGSWNWRETIYTFRRNGYSVDYFIDFSIGSDLKNTSYRIITFDQPPLGLSREYLVQGLNHTKVKAYYDYMVDIAVLFNADKARAEKELMESLELEMQLAKLSLPREDRRNANRLYNKMTLGEMMLKFPTIPWREYVTELLLHKYDIKEEEPVIIAVPEYITGVERILQQTPKRVLANYLLWRAASSTIFYLPARFRDRQQKYYRATSGSKMRHPRWMECSELAVGSVSLAVSSLYVQRYFNERAKQVALDLVDRVKKEFFHTLETLDWMDEKTRKAALEKAASMVAHIAYPEELRNKKKLVEFYKELNIDRDGDYLEAIHNLTTFGTNYTLSKLREKINKTDWISHSRAAEVNAYYSPLENSIQFPAGILQEIFFSDKRPNYMNFGTIGFVIGHEITHGFDDQGKQFDKNGDLMEWWAEETKNKYAEMAQCIIDQYSNYTSQQVNMSLNGINTQGENIADNGGLKHAYRAYLAWVADNGEESRLPGLHQFTPRQMFWVSTASSWCAAFRPESLSNQITTGYHSPPEFRILGTMSNLPEFSRDFNCPLGSSMNPVKKCVVW